MPGCGYICPKCNDSGYDDQGISCDWCRQEMPSVQEVSVNSEDEVAEWLLKVHEGPCCSDLNIDSDQSV